MDKIEELLAFTDRQPQEVLGKMLPDNRDATIWNVAVNGVMAGCRPEYMPDAGGAGGSHGRSRLWG